MTVGTGAGTLRRCPVGLRAGSIRVNPQLADNLDHPLALLARRMISASTSLEGTLPFKYAAVTHLHAHIAAGSGMGIQLFADLHFYLLICDGAIGTDTDPIFIARDAGNTGHQLPDIQLFCQGIYHTPGPWPLGQ